jgi:hypothetical protein
MKRILVALTLGLAACGNADGGPGKTEPGEESKPPEGYTRFAPPSIDMAPGEEGTYCQFVALPAEADMDILDITGEQGFPGHHAVLFATSANEPVGTTRACTDQDLVDQKFLGGVGGEGASDAFPAGAVIRLKKGQSLVMNVHYLNTSDKKVTGRSHLDIKFAPPSPDRPQASFFTSGVYQFALSPHGEATAEAKCVFPHDVKFLDFANHMHDLGVDINTKIIHADGSAEELQRDDGWKYEWQFNPPRKLWSVEAPHTLEAGDTLHTTCSWNNTTAQMITFPREMCIATGFILSDKDVNCVDGNWKE